MWWSLRKFGNSNLPTPRPIGRGVCFTTPAHFATCHGNRKRNPSPQRKVAGAKISSTKNHLRSACERKDQERENFLLPFSTLSQNLQVAIGTLAGSVETGLLDQTSFLRR